MITHLFLKKLLNHRHLQEFFVYYRKIQAFTGKLTRFSQDCETKIQAFTGKYRNILDVTGKYRHLQANTGKKGRGIGRKVVGKGRLFLHDFLGQDRLKPSIMYHN